MRNVRIVSALVVGVWVLFAFANSARVIADEGNGKIALLDDCDPRVGAGWNTAANMTGCLREEGSVSRPEFGAFLMSPLAAAVVGHPAWTISPTLTKVEPGQRIRVRNGGGRGHTFTEVADYGGGFVPALNFGLAQAPACANAQGTVIPPGGLIEINGLALGNHKFQCCIHTWMRAEVKVQPEE